jgi:hypothetical protein
VTTEGEKGNSFKQGKKERDYSKENRDRETDNNRERQKETTKRKERKGEKRPFTTSLPTSPEAQDSHPELDLIQS